MRCSKCGLENRPDARFCKQCGQALPQSGQSLRLQQADPTTLPTNICTACGATAKPKARFCPRCGKSLASDLTQPTFPGSGTTLPPSITQPYATPPSAPPPAPPLTHTQPWNLPPSPPAPATKNRSFPRWVGCTAIIVIFICIAILIALAIKFGPGLFSNKETTVALTPTTSLIALTWATMNYQEGYRL
jgi:ribosomal protein L40E